MGKGLNSVCFVQVNHLLLAKSYKNFGWINETTLKLGRNDSESEWNDRNSSESGRNDRNSMTFVFDFLSTKQKTKRSRNEQKLRLNCFCLAPQAF